MLFSATLFFIFLISYAYAFTINSCQTITSPGYYELTANLTDVSNDPCINISVSDVVLDCKGNFLDGVGENKGIVVDSFGKTIKNITLKSCEIMDFEDGVAFYSLELANISDIILENLYVHHNLENGAVFYFVKNVSIVNSTFLYNVLSQNSYLLVGGIDTYLGNIATYGSSNFYINNIVASGSYGKGLNFINTSFIIVNDSMLQNNREGDFEFIPYLNTSCEIYIENVTLTENKKLLVIKNLNNVLLENYTPSNYMIFCNISNSIIRNLTYYNVGSIRNNGVVIASSENITIENFNITRAKGIRFYNSNYVFIKNSSSRNNYILDIYFIFDKEYEKTLNTCMLVFDNFSMSSNYPIKIINETGEIVENKTYGFIMSCGKVDNFTIRNVVVKGNKTQGVALAGDNILIENLTVVGTNWGLALEKVNNVTIKNFKAYNLSNEGLSIRDINISYIENITIRNTLYDSITIGGGAYVNLSNVFLYNTTNACLYLKASDYNVITNLTAIKCYSGVYLHYSLGNTLSNLTITNQTHFGVGLIYSYENNVSNVYVYNVTYGPGVYLFYGINNFLKNVTVEDAYFYGTFLQASSKNTLIDFNFHNIYGYDQARGLILDDSFKNTFRNFYIKDVGYTGVSLFSSQQNKFRNITAINTGTHGIYFYVQSNLNDLDGAEISNVVYGVTFYQAYLNTIDDVFSHNNNYGMLLYYDSSANFIINLFSYDNQYGIGFVRGSSGNTLTLSYIHDNTYGITLDDWNWGSYPKDNLIFDNVFNNSNNFGPIDPYFNNWNITLLEGPNVVFRPFKGGNVYAKPDGTGFSETCQDANHDGICDSSYTIATNNVDYHPLALSATYPLDPKIYIGSELVWQYDGLYTGKKTIDLKNALSSYINKHCYSKVNCSVPLYVLSKSRGKINLGKLSIILGEQGDFFGWKVKIENPLLKDTYLKNVTIIGKNLETCSSNLTEPLLIEPGIAKIIKVQCSSILSCRYLEDVIVESSCGVSDKLSNYDASSDMLRCF